MSSQLTFFDEGHFLLRAVRMYLWAVVHAPVENRTEKNPYQAKHIEHQLPALHLLVSNSGVECN